MNYIIVSGILGIVTASISVYLTSSVWLRWLFHREIREIKFRTKNDSVTHTKNENVDNIIKNS